ncbi:hypothetical protein L1987_04446 [Smallanthus sonchifolius]|uniref:Uncharacterized protein n=1 Tax=Smallanthus sonchifolius TaxID=185202 RepID=A0ACB9KDI8_9ASTR|nr:hypothetical protein L1987_04446 [Smallanthus sonchifolius]
MLHPSRNANLIHHGKHIVLSKIKPKSSPSRDFFHRLIGSYGFMNVTRLKTSQIGIFNGSANASLIPQEANYSRRTSSSSSFIGSSTEFNFVLYLYSQLLVCISATLNPVLLYNLLRLRVYPSLLLISFHSHLEVHPIFEDPNSLKQVHDSLAQIQERHDAVREVEWKLLELQQFFFCGFTMPKICSSYSSQMSAYGNAYFLVNRNNDVQLAGFLAIDLIENLK